MKILLTGANSNIGTGVLPLLVAAGHEIVQSDIDNPSSQENFFPCDVQHGFGLERAAMGCDMLIHLPAWHGIHWRAKSEIDFWRLNVDGFFFAMQAAKSAGIKKLVFLSSQAWHGHYDKYGFTKRIGEELCEYHRKNHGVGYVAVRPADLTPYQNDYLNRFGAGFLYGRVHRTDVLEAVVKSVSFLEMNLSAEAPGLVVDATRANAFTADQIERWEADPLGTASKIWPEHGYLIEKYQLAIERKPHLIDSFLGWDEIGYQPKYHFGSFLEELQQADAKGEVTSRICEY